jgi:3',5'-cyclic AMP phosphodiesterase CpdA
VSKRSRRRRKRSASQTLFWIMSAVLAASMVISLIVVALPGPPTSTPTPLPAWTWAPTSTATPSPEPSTATSSPEPPTPTPTSPVLTLPTVEATDPAIGPAPASPTPVVTSTLTVTPTVTPTPASAEPGLIFAIAGDSRNDPETYGQVLASIMADGSQFLIHTGDLVNRGTEAQWQAWPETMVDFTLPFYPVPGNHDALGGELDGYLTYSGAPAAHYSFDRGPVHFTLADSHDGGISADELAWLREDLSTTTQPVKMVVLHHPPFDPDGTDHIMGYGNDEFMALMAEQEVDYVFAGHIHAYVWAERDGVQYFITGGAGAPLYTDDHPLAFYHYLHVTVQGEDVTIDVVEIQQPE